MMSFWGRFFSLVLLFALFCSPALSQAPPPVPAQFQTAEAAAVTAVQNAAAEANAEGQPLEGEQAGEVAIEALDETTQSLEEQQELSEQSAEDGLTLTVETTPAVSTALAPPDIQQTQQAAQA